MVRAKLKDGVLDLKFRVVAQSSGHVCTEHLLERTGKVIGDCLLAVLREVVAEQCVDLQYSVLRNTVTLRPSAFEKGYSDEVILSFERNRNIADRYEIQVHLDQAPEQ